MNTKIAEIPDRAACAVWCPLRSHPDVIALGGKDAGATGFEEKDVEVEIYDIASAATPVLLGSVTVSSSRFSSIAWTPYKGIQEQYPMGLLVGGMTDSKIHIWDPSQIIMNHSHDSNDNDTTDDADTDGLLSMKLVCTIQQEDDVGPISALKFSTLNPHQLCAGAANGHVSIIDFSTDVIDPHLSEPAPGHNNNRKKQIAEVTSIGWNTQVPHIVATASGDGSVTVWDLNSRKAWCEIRAEHTGQAVADIAWNPTQGLHLLTASTDDRNPVIKVWDLAASTSMELATLSGHSGGLLCTHWCPHDDALLLSCGKDNRTLLWDLCTLRPIAEVPPDIANGNDGYNQTTPEQQQQQSRMAANAIFSSTSLNEQKHMRYDCQWSPYKRGVALTCSFDRKVQIHAIGGLATKSGRPPAWMKPSSAVSLSFGGTILSCSAKAGNIVTVATLQEEPILATTSQSFEAELATTGLIDLCRQRQLMSSKQADKEIWAFLRVVFETNARQELLLHLGLSSEEITNAAAKYADDISTGIQEKTTGNGQPIIGNKDEEMIKKSLLVGNFDAAVECCFQTGNLADALILASCGGTELWTKTQQRYFDIESTKRPYLSIVNAVIHNQLDHLVSQCDTTMWQEMLAILSTYGTAEEFPRLCIALGDRLEEVGDVQNASLCFTCALNLDRTVRYWKTQLDQANDIHRGIGKSTSSSPKKSDLIALHDFVIKVSVFLEAIAPGATSTTIQLPSDVEEQFAQYAQVLADQGLLITAAKYVKGTTQNVKILRDRLYRSRASYQCLTAMGGSPPEFPYQMVAIGKSQGQTSAASIRAQQQQQQQQQQVQHQQQQQQVQQHTYSSQQYNQQASYGAAPSVAASPQPATDQLPPGWMALQDPSSGQTYYANQTTGEVTWERPQAPQQAPVQQQQQPQAAQLPYGNTHQPAATAAAPAPTPAAAATTTMAHQTSAASTAPQYGQSGPYAAANGSSSAPYGQSASYANGSSATVSFAPEPAATGPSPVAATAATAATTTTAAPIPANVSKSTRETIASRYGDGFISSASHPELASQYGNVGTSNPYTGADRPGTAQSVLGPAAIPNNQPVSGTLNLETLDLSQEQTQIKETLLGVVEALKSVNMFPTEKKQLVEVEKGVAILVKKLARSALDDDVVVKVYSLAGALSNRDYAGASSIQTTLANSVWREHKDWLKGMKLLIQMALKKL